MITAELGAAIAVVCFVAAFAGVCQFFDWVEKKTK